VPATRIVEREAGDQQPNLVNLIGLGIGNTSPASFGPLPPPTLSAAQFSLSSPGICA
jgi:hypothetical protein